MSVDCTDCPIEEPSPFEKGWSERWYSPKINGAGLRYEVAVSIIGGDIVWVNGPFPPGWYNDLDIFLNKGLVSFLEQNERVEADGGYIGADPEHCKTKYGITHSMSGRGKRNEIRARQESANSRMKMFSTVAKKSRHPITKHGSMFRAIACIVQIQIEEGETLFNINGYSDELFLKLDLNEKENKVD